MIIAESYDNFGFTETAYLTRTCCDHARGVGGFFIGRNQMKTCTKKSCKGCDKCKEPFEVHGNYD